MHAAVKAPQKLDGPLECHVNAQTREGDAVHVCVRVDTCMDPAVHLIESGASTGLQQSICIICTALSS